MKLDPQVCYKALSSRDARFDGKFYIAVRTTGVYCRPVCPAPTALFKNCTFYANAAAAEVAGYRPCLRCFPESAPGFIPGNISSQKVIDAIKHIQAGNPEANSIEALAAALGISSRHLRRLFDEHMGISPQQLIKTRRGQLAKKLIGETRLSMSKVAFIAGFPNIRQFNAEMRNTYGKPPSELRKPTKQSGPTSTISLKLCYRPPLNWQQMQNYLAPRIVDGVECFQNGRYRRVLKIDGEYGVIEIENVAARDHLTLKVPAHFWPHLQFIIRKSRQVFDLDADTQNIDRHLMTDSTLKKVVRCSRGIRLLGAWDIYELSLRAIIGQQVSVPAAATLARRLVEKTGDPIPTGVDDRLCRLFPAPEKIIDAELDNLGFTRSRVNTIKSFSDAYLSGSLQFGGHTGLEEVVSNLTQIKGIGNWTANYIAMRALRETDAFPSADLGLMKAYSLVSGRQVTANALAELSENWRPWRAYAAMHLWNSL